MSSGRSSRPPMLHYSGLAHHKIIGDIQEPFIQSTLLEEFTTDMYYGCSINFTQTEDYIYKTSINKYLRKFIYQNNVDRKFHRLVFTSNCFIYLICPVRALSLFRGHHLFRSIAYYRSFLPVSRRPRNPSPRLSLTVLPGQVKRVSHDILINVCKYLSALLFYKCEIDSV